MDSTLGADKEFKCLKIKYPKNRLQNAFTYGVIMIGIGIFAVYINSNSIFSYLWIVLGLVQLAASLYQKKNQYITIEGNKLIKHSLIPKCLDLSEIENVEEYGNSFRLETPQGSLRICRDHIEKESLPELKQFLTSLRQRRISR